MEEPQVNAPQNNDATGENSNSPSGNGNPTTGDTRQNATNQTPPNLRDNVFVQPVAGAAAMRDIRERLFEALFIRFSVSYAARFPMPARRAIESIILSMAFTSLGLLIYVHTGLTYIHPDCVNQMKETWPKDGVLRVEVIQNADPSYNLYHSYEKEEAIRQRRLEFEGHLPTELDIVAFMDEEQEKASRASASSALLVDSDHYTTEGPVIPDSTENLIGNASVPTKSEDLSSKQSEDVSEAKDPKEEFKIEVFDEAYIIEYATEYGLLHLSPAARSRLNVSVGLFILDPSNEQCFKKSLDVFIFDHFFGYDMIVMEGMKQVAESENNKGNVRNVVTGEYFRLVNSDVGGSNYFSVLFIMMMFTLIVSMLLRFSHNQIFLFIVDLLNVIETNIGMRSPVGQMLTVILALVGMEAIMSEFFKDSTTSFYVIVLVWLCDQYNALCCHTYITKKHWLRFFYLYQFAFYAHHYRFHGQYSGFALLTVVLLTFHIMIYFYHHYELPQILGAAENARQERRQRTNDMQTLGVIIQNYINRPGVVRPATQPNADPIPGIPGAIIRNTNRDDTRFGSLWVQNVVFGIGGTNQHARSAHLSVLFRSLRNALRDTRAPVDPAAAEDPPTNSDTQAEAPAVSAEPVSVARDSSVSDSAGQNAEQEIIACIDGDINSSVRSASTHVSESNSENTRDNTSRNNSISDSEIRQRHSNIQE